jgi:hypothetical protein
MKTARRIILGEGEVVGHKHALESKSVIKYQDDNDSHMPFILTSQGVLTHDEHDRMIFSPGKYRSYHQVEFNPMTQNISRVFD